MKKGFTTATSGIVTSCTTWEWCEHTRNVLTHSKHIQSVCDIGDFFPTQTSVLIQQKLENTDWHSNDSVCVCVCLSVGVVITESTAVFRASDGAVSVTECCLGCVCVNVLFSKTEPPWSLWFTSQCLTRSNGGSKWQQLKKLPWRSDLWSTGWGERAQCSTVSEPAGLSQCQTQ